MKYTPWPKRDPIKNYFQLPNEIFLLGLSPGALAVYFFYSAVRAEALPVLAQLQDHRQRSEDECQHRPRVCV